MITDILLNFGTKVAALINYKPINNNYWITVLILKWGYRDCCYH